jgi:ribose transport system permease protein
MTAISSSEALGGSQLRDWLRHHGWTLGVWLLLGALVVWYSTLVPSFGGFELSLIVNNSLPIAFLALGQAVIVIAGGIDLGVGSMMVLTNVVAAKYMEGESFAVAILIAVVLIAAAAILNGIVGWIINVSKVPDIVITLATLFIFAGFALAILPSPGGGAPGRFRWLFTGSESGIGRNAWPAIIMLALATQVVGLWLVKTRNGLSLYALGSDPTAAYLSGVRNSKAKILSYAIGGGLAAMAGLATTALTGSGSPRLSIASTATLNSVAAIVLGGIALTGGIGSVVGASGAAIVLFILNPILTARGVDPNSARVIQGLLIIFVLMIAGVLEQRRQRRS